MIIHETEKIDSLKDDINTLTRGCPFECSFTQNLVKKITPRQQDDT